MEDSISLTGGEYHRSGALGEHSPLFHFHAQKSTQSQQASVHSDDNPQMSIISQQRHASFVVKQTMQ